MICATYGKKIARVYVYVCDRGRRETDVHHALTADRVPGYQEPARVVPVGILDAAVAFDLCRRRGLIAVRTSVINNTRGGKRRSYTRSSAIHDCCRLSSRSVVAVAPLVRPSPWCNDNTYYVFNSILKVIIVSRKDNNIVITPNAIYYFTDSHCVRHNS